MRATVFITLTSAILGAIAGHLLAGGLLEGAIAGALLGGSAGLIIAMRRASGGSAPAFEYEAAGIHDDNLITIARRNLVRDAYRDSYNLRERDAKRRYDESAAESERAWHSGN